MKDSIRYRNMMGVALQACDQLLWKHRWQTLDRRVLWLPTGQKLWCVAHPASEIKAMCSTLEQSRPLGTPVGYRCNLSAERAGGTPVAGRIAAPLPAVR